MRPVDTISIKKNDTGIHRLVYVYVPGNRRTYVLQIDVRETNAQRKVFGLYTAAIDRYLEDQWATWHHLIQPIFIHMCLMFSSYSFNVWQINKLATVKGGWTEILLSAEIFSIQAAFTFQPSVCARLEIPELKTEYTYAEGLPSLSVCMTLS